MKRAFTLLELVVSMAITAVILSMISSIVIFSSKVLVKQKNTVELYDELYLVESVYKKFIDESENIEILDFALINEQNNFLYFDNINQQLYSNELLKVKTNFIEKIDIKIINNLIELDIILSEDIQYKFYYFNK